MVNAETALLQMLDLHQGPLYGTALIDAVSRRTNGKIVLKQGSVYPALQRLEAAGLARSKDVPPPPDRGGRPRRMYTLTSQGKREAAAARRAILHLFQDD